MRVHLDAAPPEIQGRGRVVGPRVGLRHLPPFVVLAPLPVLLGSAIDVPKSFRRLFAGASAKKAVRTWGRLDGRVAVITGGGHGHRRRHRRAIGSRWGGVVIADLNVAVAEDVVRGIVTDGGVASTWGVDVSEEESVAELFAATLELHGRAGCAAYNAAAVGDDGHGRDLAVADGQVEVWDRTFAVNLRGVMLGYKYAIPHMVEAGRGVIINTSSQSALAGGPGAVAYSASKLGIISVTRACCSSVRQAGHPRRRDRSRPVANRELPDERRSLVHHWCGDPDRWRRVVPSGLARRRIGTHERVGLKVPGLAMVSPCPAAEEQKREEER